MKNYATKLALRRHPKKRAMPTVELEEVLCGEKFHWVAEEVVLWVEQERTPAFFKCGDHKIDVYPGDGRDSVRRRCLKGQYGEAWSERWHRQLYSGACTRLQLQRWKSKRKKFAYWERHPERVSRPRAKQD